MKLAHNEQCIALYPLTTHYSVGRFQPVLTFGLLRAHFFLGSFLEIVSYGPLLACSVCGPNTTRGYMQPVCGPSTHWAVFIALSNTAF